MNEPTVEQELAILAHRMHNFAEILYKAAIQGRLTGYTPPTKIIWPAAGGMYTHLAYGDWMRGSELAREICRELGQSEWLCSPLERLLYTVRPGDKPGTHEALKRFIGLLEPYLLRPDNKVVDAVQQSLW